MLVRLEVRGSNFSRAVFVPVTARIETIQPVLNKPLPAQSKILKEDIEWKPARMTDARIAVSSFEFPEELEGMLTKRNLEAGQVLTADLFYSPLYIRKGETATVKASSGRISITATMRAKTSGRYGDSIVVEHLSGSGTTTARIIGPRMLEAMGEK
jgi:flagella basal body P-ring formation protein FlgA